MSDDSTVDQSAESGQFTLIFSGFAQARLFAFGSAKSGVLDDKTDNPTIKSVLEHYRVFNPLPMPTKIIGTVQGNRQPRSFTPSSEYIKGQHDGIAASEAAIRTLTRQLKEENYRREASMRNLEKQRELEALSQAKSLLSELEARREKKQNLPPLVCEPIASKIIDCYKNNYNNTNNLVACAGVVNEYSICTKNASLKWLSEQK